MGLAIDLGMYNVFLTAIRIQGRLKVAILSLFSFGTFTVGFKNPIFHSALEEPFAVFRS